MQIADGIWSVDGLRASNVYLVRGADGVVVIDSCVRGSQGAILGALRDAGYQPDGVQAIVITHAHVDHIGSLRELHRATGAPIYAPAGEIPAIEGHAPLPHPRGLIGQVFRGVNSLLRPDPVVVQHALRPGPSLTALPGWYVVPTPGHTQDHTSLYNPQRQLLIAGDALANLGGLRLAPRPFTSNIGRARASTAMLAGLPLRNVLCGHGAPVMGDVTVPRHLQTLGLPQRYRSNASHALSWR